MKRWSQVLHIRSLGDCWICASFAARGDSQETGYYKSALVTVDVRVISASLFATFFDLVLRSTSSTRTFLCDSFTSCCIHELETTPTSYTMTSRPSQDARVLSHGRGGAGKLFMYNWAALPRLRIGYGFRNGFCAATRMHHIDRVSLY